MSTARENALARMLSRTLAALETPGDLTSEELLHVKQDASKLLSRWRTLPQEVLGLTDARIVGQGLGWLVEVVTNPMDEVAHCSGKVTFCRAENQDADFKSTDTCVLFKLAIDPTLPFDEVEKSSEKIAYYVVAPFVERLLEAKGLENWAVDHVIIQRQVAGLPNASVSLAAADVDV